MLVELRGRSQITIPSEVIRAIGASEGDKFDVIYKDGGIFLCPVVVYPKLKMQKIARIIKKAEPQLPNQKSYEDVSRMFNDMGINFDEV